MLRELRSRGWIKSDGGFFSASDATRSEMAAKVGFNVLLELSRREGTRRVVVGD